MQKKLPRLMFMAVMTSAAAFAADQRRKAIRREMIEMDIAVRNLTSTIAMADRKVLDDSLQRLAGWQIKDHPELGSAFRSVLAEWQTRGIARYGIEIQKEAQALRSFAAGRPARLSDADWGKIGAGLNRMLISCQNCHEAARKEPK